MKNLIFFLLANNLFCGELDSIVIFTDCKKLFEKKVLTFEQGRELSNTENIINLYCYHYKDFDSAGYFTFFAAIGLRWINAKKACKTALERYKQRGEDEKEIAEMLLADLAKLFSDNSDANLENKKLSEIFETRLAAAVELLTHDGVFYFTEALSYYLEEAKHLYEESEITNLNGELDDFHSEDILKPELLEIFDEFSDKSTTPDYGLNRTFIDLGNFSLLDEYAYSFSAKVADLSLKDDKLLSHKKLKKVLPPKTNPSKKHSGR